MNNVTVSAVITAAGESLRMGTDQNKNFLLLAQRPVLSYSLEQCIKHPNIREIIIVHKTGETSCIQKITAACTPTDKPIRLIAGGGTRQQSSYCGICAADPANGYIMVHDAARPFADAAMIDRTLQAAVSYGGACVAVPSKDTPVFEKDGLIDQTVAREQLRLIQTPQAFRLSLIRRAHEYALEKHYTATDDSALVHFLGENVALVEGSYDNIKITTPEDLLLAELIADKLASRRKSCI